MCRFTLYLGPEIRLSSLLIDPSHSLIRQSTHSREREEPLNGDGFGVGWYARSHTPEPAVFRSITPAWNNRNLQNLVRVVSSDCILAHVRAATQSSGVNEANCHPFRYGRYLCMHNGDIGGFRAVRRRLLDSICDEAFGNVFGSTDSEHFFALIIDELLKAAPGPEPARNLGTALNNAIVRTTRLVAEYGGNEPSFLNVAITDGDHAAVSRYSDHPSVRPESLYYFTGSLYPVEADSTGGAEIAISSERLTEDAGWQEVPPNHMVITSRGGVPVVEPCGVPMREAAA